MSARQISIRTVNKWTHDFKNTALFSSCHYKGMFCKFFIHHKSSSGYQP